MKLKYIHILLFVVCSNLLNAQVSIGTNTPNASAKLDVSSTSKGVLVPRMTHTQMLAISSPIAGLQVYNTTRNALFTYNGLNWTTEKNYVAKFADKGISVDLNNIQVRIPSSGNASLQIATTSGSILLSGSSINNYYVGLTGASGASSTFSAYVRQSESFNTTFSYWQSSLSFPNHGSSQTIYLIDETNNRSYRIFCIIGYNYLSNYIEIEQLQ